MPEYIEREALMKSVNELKKSPWYNNKSGLGIGRRDGVGVVADLCIKQAPTVDVVEVVRCEECRNLVVTKTNDGFACRCRRNGLKERDIHPKCFCCYGEKYTKEGEQNDLTRSN